MASPTLWQNNDLIIYLCNKLTDVKSAQFKLKNFAKYSSSFVFKVDANNSYLNNELIHCLESGTFFNLKQLSLHPIFNLYIEEDIDGDDVYDEQLHFSMQENIFSMKKR